MQKLHYNGPVVLVVMDGVGLSPRRSGNAVRQAHLDFLNNAMLKYLNIPLAASGEAVGIMPGQMGNSEVGHNALGSGQIIKQGIAQVEEAFATGDIWQSKAWQGAMKFLKSHAQVHPTLHFAGIFSDGGVHSDIRHLEKMIQQAYNEGVRKIRIHCVFDGRDVSPQSEPKYIERLEKFCSKFPDADFRIASGAGRMVATADRYESDWGMVKRGWDMMVHGKAPRQFKHATEAIRTLRAENPHLQDQYLPPFVIVEDLAARTPLASRAILARATAGKAGRKLLPIGKVQDGDAFIYYDFRADRAVEIAQAFTEKNFDKFNRGKTNAKISSPRPKTTAAKVENGKLSIQGRTRLKFAKTPAASSAKTSAATTTKPSSGSKTTKSKAPALDAKAKTQAPETNTKTQPQNSEEKTSNWLPDIYFAGLTEYNSDRHIPKNILVPPVKIESPLNIFLGQNQISQMAISETVKFGHITYYFNGNSYKKAPREGQVEIVSDSQPFNTRPWMKSAEITDATLMALDKFRFVRLNYPGGDMVGHFGELEPTIVAMEAIDLQLQRLAAKVDALGGIMLITADHGNAEELLDKNGTPRTAHTTNPVPCIFYDNTPNAKKYRSANLKTPGLANLAATIALLLSLPDYPASWQPPLIKVKSA